MQTRDVCKLFANVFVCVGASPGALFANRPVCKLFVGVFVCDLRFANITPWVGRTHTPVKPGKAKFERGKVRRLCLACTECDAGEANARRALPLPAAPLHATPRLRACGRSIPTHLAALHAPFLPFSAATF